MRDFVKKARSFIVFDLPLQTAYICTQFSNTHRKLQNEVPGWSTNSTRQILLSYYWFRNVPAHFSLLFGLPVLLVFLLQGYSQPGSYFLSVLISGVFSFIVLYFFHYRPCFSSVFLPRLETIKEFYESKQTGEMEKCSKAQLSNFALTLVFYVFDKSSNINSLQCNDQSAKLLARLYGVDPGSLKKNLVLIFGKGKTLSVRKSTEIQNQFEEAYNFLGEINFKEGVEWLKRIEHRLLSNRPAT